MVAIMLGADNGFFYAGQVMHFSSPFTVFLIYHKQYQNNPNNPYAKLERNLYQNLHTPMAFFLHNYDEYLETGKMSDNLYDQCVFNGDLNDSTFTTYLETKKVAISNDVMRISAVTNPKYPHVSLDYPKILERNKESLQRYLSGVSTK